jgi:glycosyltransferase involved in cell wall biosynthesis
MSPRIVIVVQNLPARRDRRVWREAQALRGAEWDVTVVSPRAPGGPAREVVDGIELRSYRPLADTGSVANVMAEFAYCWLRTAWIVLQLRLRGPIDVLQACNPPDTYFVLGWLLRPFGTRFVFDHHDLSPEMLDAKNVGSSAGWLRRGLVALERATFLTADHVISTNDSVREVALTRGGVDPARVTVVRNGPDVDVMHAGPPDESLKRGRSHLALYVGMMGPQDGVEGLVEVIDHFVHGLDRTDVLFALVGTGPSLSSVRQLISARGLNDHVDLPGWLEDSDLFRYLSTASVGLCPEPATPLNDRSTMIKALEYLSFGLPVVSFDLHETRVTAGDAAVYITPGDVGSFAEAVAALVSDEGRRATMSAIGRQRAERELAWSIQAERYLEAMREAVSRPANKQRVASA